MMYLLRHGETIWNRTERFQGRLDSPLTLTGIAQARAMGHSLREETNNPRTFNIVASPLGRAWQSATIVAEVLGVDPLSIALEPRLAEMDYGTWEGLTRDDVEAGEPGVLARRSADLWRFRTPSGESYADLATRVRPWLDSLPEGASVIAVCHGATSRVLRGLYADLPHEEILTLSRTQGEIYRLSAACIETLPSNAPR